MTHCRRDRRRRARKDGIIPGKKGGSNGGGKNPCRGMTKSE
jgi:hypothetical protein